MRFVPETEELEGSVVDFSDSGTAAKAYAVVEVVRTMLLVVPVADLTLASGPEP